MAPKVASKYMHVHTRGLPEMNTSDQLTRMPSDTSQRSSNQLTRMPSDTSQRSSNQLTRMPSNTSQRSFNQLTRVPSATSQRSSNLLTRMPSATYQSPAVLIRKKSSNLSIDSSSQACAAQAGASKPGASPPEPIQASVRPIVSKLEQTTRQVADQVLPSFKEPIRPPSPTAVASVGAIDTQSKQAIDESLTAPSELPQVSDLLQSTRQRLREIFTEDGLMLEKAETWVKDDLELVKIAMIQNIKAFHLASLRLKTTKEGRELIRLALAKREIKLQNAPHWVQDDEELVATTIGVSPLSLKYASSRLKAQPSIIQLALEKEACAVMFVEPKTLDLHPHLAFEAIRKNSKAYAFIAAFFKNEDLRVQAMQASGLALKHMQGDHQTPAIVVAALENNPEAKAFIKEELINDPRVVAYLSHLATKASQIS